MNRRAFLDRLAAWPAARRRRRALLPVLQNNYAQARPFRRTTRASSAEMVDIPGAPGLGLSGASRRPRGKLPAVLVIHENRGLNPHIKDVTRRLALAGFVALGARSTCRRRRHARRRGQGARHDRRARSGRRAVAEAAPSPMLRAGRTATARSAPSASAGAAARSTAGGRRSGARRPAWPITAPSRRPRTCRRSRRR